jgi:hypothetical protein
LFVFSISLYVCHFPQRHYLNEAPTASLPSVLGVSAASNLDTSPSAVASVALWSMVQLFASPLSSLCSLLDASLMLSEIPALFAQGSPFAILLHNRMNKAASYQE